MTISTLRTVAGEFDMEPYAVAAALDVAHVSDDQEVDEAEAREVLQLMVDQAAANRA